jgi:hypothetical protein
MWHIYTIEYYSAINKNEIMLFERKMRIIMLSKISQFQEDKYCMSSLICGILKNKIKRHEHIRRNYLRNRKGNSERRE